jgi:cupin domain
VVDDTSLLRNEAGTARERDPSNLGGELELETAIARNVRESRIRHGLSVADMAERQAVFVKAGTGARALRAGSREGHEYELLGSLRGEHRRLECLHVTLNEDSSTYPLFQHPGTELVFMLEGVMDYSHSRRVYRLAAGDSLQLDGEGAHGPVGLVELPIRFLSVIAFPDSKV